MDILLREIKMILINGESAEILIYHDNWMQPGLSKCDCFLCLWDGWATIEHYMKSKRPLRSTYFPGTVNVTSIPLIDTQKIFLPPLHIK